ncbi:MAG TPA: AbrB/MazE/SpoVT family DNA-binding domain-containing protein [Spirochaeta sp.]|nr:AbrB/MazE/SpoVT family DNA-binding domain-containing protein [Spirochaeta sp.]
MLVSIIPIGNSKGIRIPKTILQQLNIQEKVDLEIHENEIHLKPVNSGIRKGWSEAFEKMAEYGDDKLQFSDIPGEGDFEWEW